MISAAEQMQPEAAGRTNASNDDDDLFSYLKPQDANSLSTVAVQLDNCCLR